MAAKKKTELVKATVKQVGDLQKILVQAIKTPMKWETALAFEAFLKVVDEETQRVLKDINFEEKKKELGDKLNKELEEQVAKETDMAKLKKETTSAEDIRKKVLDRIQSTTAKVAEDELNELFMNSEIEVPVLNYKLDETLPAMFNFVARDFDLPFFKFSV